MTPETLTWAGPAAISALAGVLWWIARRLWTKLDAIDDQLKTDLRALDVRIAVIEAHLGLTRSK